MGGTSTNRRKVGSGMEATISSLAVRRSTRSKRIGLVCTVLMVAMAGVGGVLDLAHYNFPLARGLGMPWFVGIILGVCKLLALATFLTRRVPTLREWAYAGLTFGLLGAAACHILSRSPVYYAVPALFDWSFVIVSYLLWHRAPKEVR